MAANVQGNRVGTNAAGTAAIPNGGHGVLAIRMVDVRIENNLISGNVGSGVWLEDSDNVLVYSNFIGTTADGTAAIPNIHGIMINGGSNHRIGRDLKGNLISGNRGDGIVLTGRTQNNSLAFNRIGLRAAGDFPSLGNEGHGIHVIHASNNVIGGNTIANSGYGPIIGQFPYPRDGVHVVAGTGNDLRANAIFGNRRLGINLLSVPEPASGVTANDFLDPDTGPNRLQNFPELTSATIWGGTLTLWGNIHTNPSAGVRLEFFTSRTCDPSGYGEGEVYFGSHTGVTSPTTGIFNFLGLSFPSTVDTGFVTATATNTVTGDTSEFSACVAITAGSAPGGGGDGGVAALLDELPGPQRLAPLPTPLALPGAVPAEAGPDGRAAATAVPFGERPLRPARGTVPSRLDGRARDAVFAAGLPAAGWELR